MKPKVFISQFMPAQGVELIRQHCDVDYHDATALSRRDFLDRAREADGLVVFMTDSVDAAMIEECPKLKVIASFGKGFDNIDIGACHRRNIVVTVNIDELTHSTADMAIGLLLAVSRNILPSDRAIRKAEFRGWHPTHFLGNDFHHSRLGIFGLGAIGQAIARRARGFDVKVSYYDPVRKPDSEEKLDLTFMDKDRLLSENDFIILAVGLCAETIRLIGRQELAIIKPGSYLINIGRGSVVDESAVGEALRSGKLRGYAADVFAFEDALSPDKPGYIPDELLTVRDNTVFTSHLGTGTIEARNNLAVSTALQLVSALHGESPAGIVNKLS
ncbi:MAG: NAD(P)-dependent oxidoreductase [Negativicutes bacterium]|nr:NAD(P)-dependent oxidoreductase [Negativicutes bacterium]